MCAARRPPEELCSPSRGPEVVRNTRARKVASAVAAGILIAAVALVGLDGGGRTAALEQVGAALGSHPPAAPPPSLFQVKVPEGVAAGQLFSATVPGHGVVEVKAPAAAATGELVDISLPAEEARPILFDVTVPQGVKAGQSFLVQAPGGQGEMMVTVPEGKKGGDAIQVSAGGGGFTSLHSAAAGRVRDQEHRGKPEWEMQQTGPARFQELAGGVNLRMSTMGNGAQPTARRQQLLPQQQRVNQQQVQQQQQQRPVIAMAVPAPPQQQAARAEIAVATPIRQQQLNAPPQHPAPPHPPIPQAAPHPPPQGVAQHPVPAAAHPPLPLHPAGAHPPPQHGAPMTAHPPMHIAPAQHPPPHQPMAGPHPLQQPQAAHPPSTQAGPAASHLPPRPAAVAPPPAAAPTGPLAASVAARASRKAAQKAAAAPAPAPAVAVAQPAAVAAPPPPVVAAAAPAPPPVAAKLPASETAGNTVAAAEGLKLGHRDFSKAYDMSVPIADQQVDPNYAGEVLPAPTASTNKYDVHIFAPLPPEGRRQRGVATTWKMQDQAWEVNKDLIRKQHLFRWMLQPGEWQKIDSYSGHPLPPKEYFEPVQD